MSVFSRRPLEGLDDKRQPLLNLDHTGKHQRCNLIIERKWNLWNLNGKAIESQWRKVYQTEIINYPKCVIVESVL